jgi:uncharacterized membrane protein SpoIIM required for sporulation
MRVAERLREREASWRELDALLTRMAGSRKARLNSREILRMGELYRSACTDLMLAEDHNLPRETVADLHALVGRAHNLVYRASGFNFRDLGRALFQSAPRRLRSDLALRISALVFWGAFFFTGLLAAGREDFARQVVGERTLEAVDESYSQPIDAERKDGLRRNDTMMAGFYVFNNASIGLRCFAWGILFGLGSLYQLLYNAIFFGALFGYMTTRPHWVNFYTFVTAHASFELTAIVVAGAAGLRLGWGLIDTQGQSRLASLRREATNALPAVGASVVLFVLAALVEGYVSASSLPYWVKAAVAILSAAGIIVYLSLGGRGQRAASGAEHVQSRGDVLDLKQPRLTKLDPGVNDRPTARQPAV